MKKVLRNMAMGQAEADNSVRSWGDVAAFGPQVVFAANAMDEAGVKYLTSPKGGMTYTAASLSGR